MGSAPLGPFYSEHYMQQGKKEAWFLVALLDEQDRQCWAMLPNVRGCGFVFSSRAGVNDWLACNGFLSTNSDSIARSTETSDDNG
jgi:hypothetical protein